MKLLENKPEFINSGLSVIRNAIAFGSGRETNVSAKVETEPETADNEIRSSLLQNLSEGLYLTGTFLGINDGYLAQ